MQLHELRPNQGKKWRKRVGRGGKRGTFSGRGSKGQRARAGHRIRPAERDLFMRIPKRRGVKHISLAPRPVIVKIGDLGRLFPDGEVTPRALVKRGLIRKPGDRVKILDGGEVRQPFTVRGIEVSAQAKEKIIAAGGTITVRVRR